MKTPESSLYEFNDVVTPINGKVQPEKAAEPDLPKVQSRRASEISPEPISWLWEPHFAFGKFSMIIGDPGLGKSTLTAMLASHVSTGRCWPDGMLCSQGEVLLVNAEDDPGDTTRPRLDAAGANPHCVHILDSVTDYMRGGVKSFNLGDMWAIEDFIVRNPTVRMIILDPISAFLVDIDSHRNSDVRGLLAPIAALAAKWRIAIIGISHLNKAQSAAIYRVSGSLGFVAAARSVYLLGKPEENTEKRVLVPVKNNLGPNTFGVAYRILANEAKVPFVEWLNEKVELTADQLLNKDNNDQSSATDDCADWLKSLFADGPLKAKDVACAAEDLGFSAKTLRRAKEKLGVCTNKASMAGGWELRLDKK